jgi:hypothetical protein
MKPHHITLSLCVAACLIVAFGSCVTPGDMQRVQDAQTRYQEKLDEKLDDLAAGAITEAEFKAAQELAQRDRNEELEQVKEDIEDRTKGFGGILQDPIGVLLGGIGSFVATNAVRNRSRRRALTAVKKDIDETDEWVAEIERKSQPGS